MAQCNHLPWYGQWWWLSCWWPRWREQSICRWLLRFFLFFSFPLSFFVYFLSWPSNHLYSCDLWWCIACRIWARQSVPAVVHRGHILGLPHAYIIKIHKTPEMTAVVSSTNLSMPFNNLCKNILSCYCVASGSPCGVQQCAPAVCHLFPDANTAETYRETDTF